MMRRLGLVLAVVIGTGSAHADTAQEQADKLFAEGRELMTKKGDSKAACEKFEAAIKLDPTATGTMLNLGLCYNNLNKIGTSLRWFRRAQAAASEGRQPEHEAAAKKYTGELAARVPWVTIQATEQPTGMEIRLDGVKVDPTDYARIEVDPGHHEVDIKAKRKTPQHLTFDIAEKENKPLTLAAFVDAPPVYVDRGVARRKNAYVFGGIGGGLLIGTGIYGLIEHAVNKRAVDRGKTDCVPGVDPTACAKDIDSAQASINRLKYIGTSAFVAGCVGLAAGITLYLTAPGKERVEEARLWTPYVTPDQVGFAVSGSF